MNIEVAGHDPFGMASAAGVTDVAPTRYEVVDRYQGGREVFVGHIEQIAPLDNMDLMRFGFVPWGAIRTAKVRQ